ncbi:MAG: glutamate-5-semialdehyde dehydrogenase [Pseudomonadota bacterium]
MNELEHYMNQLGQRARLAVAAMARANAERKAQALAAAADAIRTDSELILIANAKDLDHGQNKGLSEAMLDRLLLDAERIDAIADSVSAIATMADPIGAVMDSWERPNGLIIERRRVPLGVIGIIYESRPNVTADAAALAVKSGNAVILRGGSDSHHSSIALHAPITTALAAHGLPATAVQLVETTDRAAVGMMLSGLDGNVDVIVPRGGRRLIERVQQDARVPVLGHLEGICHVYVDRSARKEIALPVVVNAKMRRTGICGAAETLLLDTNGDEALHRQLLSALHDAGCELRGDAFARGLHENVQPANDKDWGCEFLSAVIAVRGVAGVDGAVEHIARYGSGHTESIIAQKPDTVATFLNHVDSAIVMHNTSTQFADGGEFGMGAEIGIATGKLHARGPVGAEQLTSYKYVVHGNGQIRS